MSNPIINHSATAGIVDELAKQLEALDLKIIDLKLDLSNARHQRKDISRRLEEFRASKTPIRRLPNEILAMVFENHREDQKERNVALMCVCKLWHKVVMNTPTLWNNIILTLFTIENLPKIWSHACFCLDHSGKLLLDVVLNANNFHPVHPFKTMASTYEKYYRLIYDKRHEQELMDYLEEVEDFIGPPDFFGMYESSLLMTLAILRGRKDQFLSRWRKLSVYVSFEVPYTVAYNLWNSIDGVTKELTHLAFQGGYSAAEDWEQTGFPNLEHLIVFDNGLELDFSRAAVCLQRLRLDCDHGWAYFLHSDASKFQSLILLYLSFIPDQDFNFDDRISLPALQALVLGGNERAFTIIPQIKAPSLTHLSLTSGHHAEFTSCSLLRTVTDLLWDCDHGLERLVQITPALERIHVLYGSADEYLQDALDAGGVMIVEGRGPIQCADNCEDWPYVYPLESDLLHFEWDKDGWAPTLFYS